MIRGCCCFLVFFFFWKEAGARFVFFQARKAIERLMKTYLHRSYEILYFLRAADFKNVSHNLKIYLHLHQYTTCKLIISTLMYQIVVSILSRGYEWSELLQDECNKKKEPNKRCGLVWWEITFVDWGEGSCVFRSTNFRRLINSNF